MLEVSGGNMSDFALLLGRMLLVSIFIYSGVAKLLGVTATATYIASKGLPFPQVLAVAAGVIEAGGGLMILVGWYTRFAAVVLAVFTLAALFLFHDFWNLPPGGERMAQMVHAWKNLSIIGGLLVLAGAGAGKWSTDGQGKA
jgi:putative oxidoreductase